MEKPIYEKWELRTLQKFIEEAPDEGLDRRDELIGYIQDAQYEKHQIYDMLSGEAHTLESRAKELREISNAFSTTKENLPLLINDNNVAIRMTAPWRLSRGL
jgi:hypothetical protein